MNFVFFFVRRDNYNFMVLILAVCGMLIEAIITVIMTVLIQCTMRGLLIWMNGVHGDIRSLEPSYIVPLFALQFYLFARNSQKILLRCVCECARVRVSIFAHQPYRSELGRKRKVLWLLFVIAEWRPFRSILFDLVWFWAIARHVQWKQETSGQKCDLFQNAFDAFVWKTKNLWIYLLL